jgi:hypothetical protein
MEQASALLPQLRPSIFLRFALLPRALSSPTVLPLPAKMKSFHSLSKAVLTDPIIRLLESG